jgi:ATP-dependent Clp protease ATP-binding subunit ClpA
MSTISFDTSYGDTSQCDFQVKPRVSVDAPALSNWSPAIKDPFLRELQNESSYWERFKDCIRSKSPLRQKIEKLSEATDLDKNWDANLKLLVRAFGSVDYHALRPHLRIIFKKLSLEQTGELFNEFIEQGAKGKGVDALHNCLRIISVKELEEMMGNKINESGMTAHEAMQNMALTEREYRKIITSSADTTLKQHGKSLANLFHGIMDTLLMSISFLDMGKEPASSWEAAHLLEIYGKLFGAPLIIFAALATLTTPVTAIMLTASIIFSIIMALYAYIKWIKPCPQHIDLCKNLLAAAEKGELAPVLAREKEIDEVLHCLAGSTDTHRAHPLLCGKSGIGKTEIVRGVAQRLATGNVPKKLKGKTLLVINTADLIDNGNSYDSQDKIQKLLNRLGKHKKDVIIFFDEVHKAMPEISDRLKTVIDTSIDSLPYVIAATTEDEYQKHIAGDSAFARRFQKIDVLPTTKEQTKLILRETANREAADIGISEKSLDLIAEMSTSKMSGIVAQPAAGKRILNNAFTLIRERQSDRYSPPDLQQKMQELANLSSAVHAEPEAGDSADKIARISILKADITELRAEQNKAQKKFKALSRLKKFRAEQIKTVFETACKVDEDPKSKDKDTNQLKKLFLFSNYYSIPFLRSRIEDIHKQNMTDQSISASEDSSTEIGERMITDLIERELAANKKKDDAEKPSTNKIEISGTKNVKIVLVSHE